MILPEKRRARAERVRGWVGMGVGPGRGSVLLRRWVMEAKATGAFRVGIVAIAGLAVIFSSIGCQSSQVSSVNPTNPMCPICGRPTQAQPTAALSCSKVVCPICGAVSRVDQDFLDRLEIFAGGPVGDTVYACAMCDTIVRECAACRAKGGALMRRNIRP
jgi:hypothetical protein